jgi:hypothetical protein
MFNKYSGKAGNIVIALDNKGSSTSPFISVMHIASAMGPRGYGIVVRTDRHARKDVDLGEVGRGQAGCVEGVNLLSLRSPSSRGQSEQRAGYNQFFYGPFNMSH